MEMTHKFVEMMNEINNANRFHSRGSGWYEEYEQKAKILANEYFSEHAQHFAIISNLIGDIRMPYFDMGNINSTHLFGLDELIIFTFYQNNTVKYKSVADIGANIGLHSIVLGKLGLDVISYEPDPLHFKQLSKNLELNMLNFVPIKAAVSTQSGTANFTRVLGNTTSSHLTGSKKPYGKLESFEVKLVNIRDIVGSVDLIKMDVEGHEADLITSIDFYELKSTDIILEIGNIKNAEKIFRHVNESGASIYSQKLNWKRAEKKEDLPTGHREGSVFITFQEDWKWEKP